MQKNTIPNWVWILILIIAIAVIYYVIQKNVKVTAKRLNDFLLKKQKEFSLLTQELEKLEWKKRLIDRQINRLFFIIKASFVSIVGIIVLYTILYNNADPVNTILSSFGILGGIYYTILFLAYRKMFDVNVCQRIVYARLKIWMYKRNRFEFARIVAVREMIGVKKIEVSDLQRRII
jgi:hypothetical protein